MKKFIYILFLITSALIINGCITFHKINYEISITSDSSGNASVSIYDLRSDAQGSSALDEDIDYLYNYALKSKKFLEQMKLEGKEITDRKVEVSNDTVSGFLKFNFKSLKAFGNLTFEAGYYILTLSPGDSIIATNGQILSTKNDLRILWEDETKTISYTLLGNSYEKENFTNLAPYYKK